MILLTDKAKEKITEIAKSEGLDQVNVRVRIIGGGCAGMTHDFYFDDQIMDSDEVSDFGDIKIVIDLLSFQYLENVTIDYIESPLGGGFKFTSPDIKSTCGCGSSVSY